MQIVAGSTHKYREIWLIVKNNCITELIPKQFISMLHIVTEYIISQKLLMQCSLAKYSLRELLKRNI